jgi:hypothetical protein
MKILSLLHATRGTPERALATRKVWLDRATHPDRVEHIFGIQSDDAASACSFAEYSHGVSVPPPEWASSSVANWNAAAALSTGEILIVRRRAGVVLLRSRLLAARRSHVPSGGLPGALQQAWVCLPP